MKERRQERTFSLCVRDFSLWQPVCLAARVLGSLSTKLKVWRKGLNLPDPRRARENLEEEEGSRTSSGPTAAVATRNSYFREFQVQTTHTGRRCAVFFSVFWINLNAECAYWIKVPPNKRSKGEEEFRSKETMWIRLWPFASAAKFPRNTTQSAIFSKILGLSCIIVCYKEVKWQPATSAD